MRKYSSFFVFLLSVSSVEAQFSNGQAARAVFGQQNFTAGVASPSQVILGGVGGLAYYGGVLYVADSNRVAATPLNSRIMAFPTGQVPGVRDNVASAGLTNTDCYLCGFPASFSLGQSTFTPADASAGFPAARTQSGLNHATGVATDGRYFAVADTDNNRVLLWNSVPTAMNQPADLVLGQTDFGSFKTPQLIDATALRGPQGVWIQNNKLFVADTQNNRVLIWNSIPTQNNQAADLVLGQADFAHKSGPAPSVTNPATAANQLLNPTAVSSDGTHLFVSDLGFNRVLIWNSIPNTIDQNADVVIGQADMTTSVANNPAVCTGLTTGTLGQCQASLDYPRYVLSDGTRLFIADGGNDRVVILNHIPTANGASFDNVLGQPDFIQNIVSSASISIASTAIDNTGGVDLTPTPQALAYDGANLYVSDPYNRRVLIFSPGDNNLPPNSIVNWASEIVRQEGIVSFSGTPVANDTATVTIASVVYTYTVKTGDTSDSIARGLVDLVNATDANTTALFAGNGSGTIYLSSKGSDLAYATISLSAATSNTANEAVSTSGSYLSAGTAATAALGMLVEINGTNLADQTASANLDGSSSLPTTLAGVQVFMDGYACPILKASATQIVTQVPYAYGNRNSTSVYVRTTHNDGTVTVTNAMPVYIAPANPGIFNAPAYAGQPRPWPAAMAYHQPSNATAVVSIDGSIKAGDVATITIAGTAYNYTVAATDTLTTVSQNLVNLINATDSNVSASLGGAFNRVVLTAKKTLGGGYGITVAGSASASASVTVSAYNTITCCVVTPGSPISPANPAGPGELITVTGAGLGLITDPTSGSSIPIGTGSPYSGPEPNNAFSFVSATMGNSTAQVIFAGLPSGSYGTYSIQVVVPPGAATNSATPLYVAQNAFISNIVTIPVGPTIVYTGGGTVAPPSTSIREVIDAPAAGSTISGSQLLASGWALDTAGAISSVDVYVDGTFFGTASRSNARPDVCAIYSSSDCPNTGWFIPFDSTQFSDGPHSMSITATSGSGARFTVSQSFTIANYTSSTYPLRGIIDSPSSDGIYHGQVTFSGWSLNDNSAVAGVSIYIDGAAVGAATLVERADVCAAYPGRPGCDKVGWSFAYDTPGLANGTHTITAKSISDNGQTFAFSKSFTVSNRTSFSSTRAVIDTPSAGAGAFNGMVSLSGWAIDDNSRIGSVTVLVDGVSYGAAAYGGSRTDVCAAFPNRLGCPNVGFSALVDTTLLADGAHIISVVVNPAAGPSSTYTRSFSILNQGTAANPVLTIIDAPSTGASVTGAFSTSGWAYGSASPVTSVQLLVDGKSYGSASYGGSRPDVCTAGSNPGCPNVGWSASLDSGSLSNGSHVLEATITTAAGQRASAGKTFFVSNPTTGPGHLVFDVPGVNEPLRGRALLSGWALNDVTRVSSLSVTIDGVPYGAATYDLPRTDVCSVYPGKPNCPNVGWSLDLDTSQLIDGTHSLAITSNNADGSFFTASRDFVVANYSSVNPTRIVVDAPAVASIPSSGVIGISGWAIDDYGQIGNVTLAVDGIPIGLAAYGGARADVCSVFSGRQGCPNVGFSLLYDTRLLVNGTHTVAVTATTTGGQASTFSKQFSTAN